MLCVFCEGSPTTNEHVFPRWLNKHLAGPTVLLEQARYGEGDYDIVRAHQGLDFRVKSVCASCNNGWMSQLEVSARGILESMILSLTPRLISPTDQRTLAMWATKTAMMLDQTQADPVLSRVAMSRLRSHRAIPGGTHVFIGANDERMPLVTAHTVRIELEKIESPTDPMMRGMYTPMKLGHLCLYVYIPGAATVVVGLPNFARLAVAPVWPRKRRHLPWPPPGLTEGGEGFERFADALWRDWVVADG